MGLFDKVKAGVKNVDSKLGEEYDEVGIRKKIHDQNSKMNDLYRDLGKLYHSDGRYGKKEKDLKSICKDIDECQETIEKLEKELADVKEKGKEERERNRREAD